MPILGNSAEGCGPRLPSTPFLARRITAGRWSMTRYSDDEIADESLPPDDPTDEKRCAACGERIDPTHRHPAATAPDDPTTVYLFCSDDCRAEWTAGAGTDADAN